MEAVDGAALLRLSSLSIPLGAAVTLFGCWFFGPCPDDGPVPGYQSAILLQGSFQLVKPKTPVPGPSFHPQLEVPFPIVVFLSVVNLVNGYC